MSETKIIDGKATAANIRAELKKDVDRLKAEQDIHPGLAVVLVGGDPASSVYVKNKIKACHEVGITSIEKLLPDTVSEEELLEEVEALNQNEKVHGILVQLPLPKHIDEQKIIHAILPHKDVDGFHPVNIGNMWLGEDTLQPCTPTGCMTLIRQATDSLVGKHAVIVGRSNIVGKPMAAMLLQESCTVVITHSKTANLAEEIKRADIVVAAVGRPEMIKGDWIKPGAIVIDVGINRVQGDAGHTKLVGDVAFDECTGVASAITPVPGGVGPMTIACLLQNTIKASKIKN